MLSILIPVYNFDVRALVETLHKQALRLKIDFEIIVLDDASSEISFCKANQILNSFAHVKYDELPKNIGRSAIRNLLARKAKYDELLFIDGDSQIDLDDFLSNYIAQIGSGVVCGGLVYQVLPPTDKNKILRWSYGKRSESISATKRNKTPYRAFQTSSFLIPKNIYLSIQLNESLLEYGHEDTLFGYELQKRNVPVLHINNPICHIGLETAGDFIIKTKQGLNNLHYLIINNFPIGDIKLVKFYKMFHHSLVAGLIKTLYHVYEKKIIRNLSSSNPNLILFDFMKLSELLRK